MSAPRGIAGFILVGGQSVRMGQPKAMLPWGDGFNLAQHLAQELTQVADRVYLVGDPAAYGNLGYPVIPDRVSGRGPLSGLEAALCSPWASSWNLIAACDLPRADRALFSQLVNQAYLVPEHVDCVVPRHDTGKLEPLCAIYRGRCGELVSQALGKGTRRVVDAVGMLQASFWQVGESRLFQNVNTPPEWNQYLHDR